MCKGCASVVEGTGYITLLSNNHTSETVPTSYIISSQYPASASYSSLRTACVRSLSCELSSGREGPVIFGYSDVDTNNSEDVTVSNTEWCLAYMFRIKDNKSRGFTRWYSLLYLLQDSSQLVSTSELITKLFEKLIIEMQQRAHRLFDKEKTQSNEVQSTTTIRAPIRTHGMFRREVGSSNVRYLSDLMEDNNFYVYLHTYFTWMLNSLQFKFINFPLSNSPFIVDKIDINNNTNSNTSIFVSKLLYINSYNELATILGIDRFKTILYHLLIGNQIVIRSDIQSKEIAHSIVQLIQVIIFNIIKNNFIILIK